MKTGLALSGGAVRGMAHIGVLKYLEEENIEIHRVAGTSAGSLVGALFASGKKAEEIEEIALDIHWKDILKYIYSVSFPKKGLINIEFLKKIFDRYLGGLTFEELEIPLTVVAVDLLNSRVVHINQGDLTSALMASCAIPGIFTPVEREGLFLVDGGVLQNVPTSPLAEAGMETIIAVNLNTHLLPDETPGSIFDILYRTLYMMTRENEKEDSQRATFLVEPNLENMGLWELDKTKELIELGYREARKVLGEEMKKIKQKGGNEKGKPLWQKIFSR